MSVLSVKQNKIMINITLENEYEKAIVVLALREFASNELAKAIANYKAVQMTEGQKCSDRAESASSIANRIK